MAKKIQNPQKNLSMMASLPSMCRNRPETKHSNHFGNILFHQMERHRQRRVNLSGLPAERSMSFWIMAA